MNSGIEPKDYSLHAFRKLLKEEKEKYMHLARKYWSQRCGSELIMEVVAANLWMKEMTQEDEQTK